MSALGLDVEFHFPDDDVETDVEGFIGVDDVVSLLILLNNIVDEFVSSDWYWLFEGVDEESDWCLGDGSSTDDVVTLGAIWGRSIHDTEGTLVVLATVGELFLEFADLLLEVVYCVDFRGFEWHVSVVELWDDAEGGWVGVVIQEVDLLEGR